MPHWLARRFLALPDRTGLLALKGLGSRLIHTQNAMSAAKAIADKTLAASLS